MLLPTSLLKGFSTMLVLGKTSLRIACLSQECNKGLAMKLTKVLKKQLTLRTLQTFLMEWGQLIAMLLCLQLYKGRGLILTISVIQSDRRYVRQIVLKYRIFRDGALRYR